MENKERGASTVELAIILPLLFIALLGIVEFGFLMYDKAVITNASREGARKGIVFHQPGSGTAWADVLGQIETAANNYGMRHLVSFGDGSASPSVLIEGNCFITGSQLTVTVSYPYKFLVLPRFLLATSGGQSAVSSSLNEGSGSTGEIMLSGVTVMNCENQ